MGESKIHTQLRDALVAWFLSEYGPDIRPYLLVDDAVLESGHCPPMIEGYIPDVYLGVSLDRGPIIGEAKTAEDLERRHSRAQFIGFLTHLARYPGSRLVVAVPWYTINQTKSLIWYLRRRCNADAVALSVLEKLPG